MPSGVKGLHHTSIAPMISRSPLGAESLPPVRSECHSYPGERERQSGGHAIPDAVWSQASPLQRAAILPVADECSPLQMTGDGCLGLAPEEAVRPWSPRVANSTVPDGCRPDRARQHRSPFLAGARSPPVARPESTGSVSLWRGDLRQERRYG